MPLRGLR